jgi:hypothetical protein
MVKLGPARISYPVRTWPLYPIDARLWEALRDGLAEIEPFAPKTVEARAEELRIADPPELRVDDGSLTLQLDVWRTVRYAVVHWWAMRIALRPEWFIDLCARYGIEIAAVHDLVALLLEGPLVPLIVCGGRLRLVVRRLPGATSTPRVLMGEYGVDHYSALEPEVQRRVDDLSVTGRCACALCERLRASDPRFAASPTGAAARAWTLFGDDPLAAQLADDAGRALAAVDFRRLRQRESPSPPALLVLGDWLEERGERVTDGDLAGLVLNWARGRQLSDDSGVATSSSPRRSAATPNLQAIPDAASIKSEPKR